MPVIEAGSGHKVPAMAVKESIEKIYPGKYDIKVIDFAKECGALKDDKALKDGWDFLLKYPVLARFGYKIMGFFKIDSRVYLQWCAKEYLTKGMLYIKEYNPDILFIPHMFSMSVAAMAREKYDLSCKIVGYITDPFDACEWWKDKGVDMTLVSSEVARQKLIKMGIDEKKILIYSFPVRHSFFNIKKTKNELVNEYGIDVSKKIVLTSAGGQGIGTASGKYVEEMYKKQMPFNVLFVCGKNEKLKQHLDDLKKNVVSSTNLIPLGYVNNMNELLSISDFIIGKGGASTTMEALMMGCPIIYTDYAAPNEKTNIDFVVENKTGWYASSKSIFFKIIKKIQNTGILNEYRDNAKKLKLRSGADEIAKFVVEMLENG